MAPHYGLFRFAAKGRRMNIVVEDLNKLGENDTGATFTLETRPTSGFIFAQRKKGSKSGNHYHTGVSGTKDPEIILLTSGEVSLYGKDMESGEEFEQIVKAPAQVAIGKNILHTLTALSDITFLEFNSIQEHQADTQYPD